MRKYIIKEENKLDKEMGDLLKAAVRAMSYIPMLEEDQELFEWMST